jgi:hypothetical protein
MSAETIRLEEYTGVIQNKLVAVWQAPEATAPWLPTEFMLAQYITRILVTGRTSPVSIALAADPSWTQVWRSPGGKEWACLLGLLQHMPGPILIVVGPDITMTPKLTQTLRGAAASIFVMRAPGFTWSGDPADHVFFPVIEPRHTALIAVLQEWIGRTGPRSLDIKTLLPQLAAQGYALTATNGLWHWYRPADSTGLVTLTAPQIARQLQGLAAVLERIGI